MNFPPLGKNARFWWLYLAREMDRLAGPSWKVQDPEPFDPGKSSYVWAYLTRERGGMTEFFYLDCLKLCYAWEAEGTDRSGGGHHRGEVPESAAECARLAAFLREVHGP